jgi:hypothetical protein
MVPRGASAPAGRPRNRNGVAISRGRSYACPSPTRGGLRGAWMRADFFVAIALAVGALTGSIPASLAPVLFPHISRKTLTTVFYSALLLTALLFVVALYFALGNEPSQVIRSQKMLALACMMIFAVGFLVSIRWFLSQDDETIASSEQPAAGGSALAANHGIAIGGNAGNAGNPGSIALGGTGGNAEAAGPGSYAAGGPGGRGGAIPGGPGGNAVASGGGMALGGQGGEAPQPDGRGGRGVQNGLIAHGFPDQLLPNGHWISEYGRGGNGSNAPQYNERLNIIGELNAEYMKAHPKLGGDHWTSKTAVPLEWLNRRLTQLGKDWRVRITDGEYEFYGR